MRSLRKKQFKQRFDKLPPNHSSFHAKMVRSTEHRKKPHWEYRIDDNYRATCYREGDTYVWVFIGKHEEFDRMY